MKITKIAFLLIILFISVNLLSYIIIQVKTGTNLFSKENYHNKKKSFYIKDPVSKYLHPFFGNIDVNNKILKKNALTSEKLIYDIFESKNNNYNQTIKILLLGGSTAINYSNNTPQAYSLKNDTNNLKSVDILAKKISEAFPDKKIIFYNAAIKSSKQPQQLFKLYYLSLIGVNFDIVINFDGPFELAHPFVKNFPLKDELIYPRRYSDDVISMSRDLSCIKNNNIESLRSSNLPIIELISYLKIRKCYKETSIIGKSKKNWKKFIEIQNRDEQEIVNVSYQIWKNSSEEIEKFSQLKNFFYLHVISPSQYISDSKKFSSTELNKFIGYEYGPILKKYYNELFNFSDLSLNNHLDLKHIFKNETKTIYRDKCCRFNDLGINILSEEISNYLKSNFNPKVVKN